jgi:hypothetical protein
VNATPPAGADTGETLELVRRQPAPHARERAPSAVVLLAGTVRESPLARGARRALLDLPLTPTTTIGGMWAQRIQELADAVGAPSLPLFIATTPVSPDVPSAQPTPLAGATFVPDASPLRGTGGALVDLCDRFSEADTILVANAHAVAMRPLASTVRALFDAKSEVVLHADENSAPTGMFLARVSALLDIPRRGFVDFKEQALSRIAASHAVHVVRELGPHVAPVRTLDGYIRAVRFFAASPGGAGAVGGVGGGGGAGELSDPLAEEWRSTFSLADAGASVAPDARLVDSVVLAGAKVGAGAVVVRSVICPGAQVAAGAFVGDQVVDVAGDAS